MGMERCEQVSTILVYYPGLLSPSISTYRERYYNNNAFWS
jgi:hypothetical protein